MSYIVITNKGTVDVPLAVNLLGASIKDDENDPIGMFGSGLKYAMAQCMRQGTRLHVSSMGTIYSLETEEVTFKDRPLTRGILIDHEKGKSHQTSITSDFGQHDWNENWFIFRELFANALDETADKDEALYCFSDKPVLAKSNETVVSIEKAPFTDMLNNFSSYFQIGKEAFVEPGNGVVFKRGVRVGKVKGAKLNWGSPDIDLSESRKMDTYSAQRELVSLMQECLDPEIWKLLLTSNDDFIKDIDINFRWVSEENQVGVYATLHKALQNLYGKEYVLAPDSIAAALDLVSMGYPVAALPSNWRLEIKKPLRSWEMLGLSGAEPSRLPTDSELDRIAWALKLMKQHYGVYFSANDVRVLKTDHPIKGQADRTSGLIAIEEEVFKGSDGKFLQTVFHEVGHVKSGAGDIDRKFTEWFIELMSSQMISHNEDRR